MDAIVGAARPPQAMLARLVVTCGGQLVHVLGIVGHACELRLCWDLLPLLGPATCGDACGGSTINVYSLVRDVSKMLTSKHWVRSSVRTNVFLTKRRWGEKHISGRVGEPGTLFVSRWGRKLRKLDERLTCLHVEQLWKKVIFGWCGFADGGEAKSRPDFCRGQCDYFSLI